jgi:Mg-chelatase subunit ChlI
MPLVDLPLGATEDRLVGTLHLERALQTGERHFQPGLLAAVNRGILYVDEVNLLADHLVDLLLDVAASGINVVEREGLQLTHPARFLLVGTMNPEEGELRPQFLDRFALMADASGLEDPADRSEIVYRRLAFEADPEGFHRSWVAAERHLAARVLAARDRLAEVILPADLIDRAVRLAVAVGSHGHRADLALVKAARAHAALLERTTVEPADLAEAARFALPHRLQSDPLDSPKKLVGRIEDALALVWGISRPVVPEWGGDQDAGDLQGETMMVPGATAAGSMLFSFLKKKLPQA